MMYSQELIEKIIYTDIDEDNIHLLPTLVSFREGIKFDEIKSGDFAVKVLDDDEGDITYKPAIYRVVNNTNYVKHETITKPLAMNVDIDYVQTDDLEIIPTHGHLSVQIYYPTSAKLTRLSTGIAKLFWHNQPLVYTDTLGDVNITSLVQLTTCLYKSFVTLDSRTSELHHHTMSAMLDPAQIKHDLIRTTLDGITSLSFKVDPESIYELSNIRTLVEPVPDMI